MREDLDFLFQKAMRSKDWYFMVDVFSLLIDAEWYVESEYLSNRMLGFMRNEFCPDAEKFDKFSFLLEDSQLGQDWYL